MSGLDKEPPANQFQRRGRAKFGSWECSCMGFGSFLCRPQSIVQLMSIRRDCRLVSVRFWMRKRNVWLAGSRLVLCGGVQVRLSGMKQRRVASNERNRNGVVIVRYIYLQMLKTRENCHRAYFGFPSYFGVECIRAHAFPSFAQVRTTNAPKDRRVNLTVNSERPSGTIHSCGGWKLNQSPSLVGIENTGLCTADVPPTGPPGGPVLGVPVPSRLRV